MSVVEIQTIDLRIGSDSHIVIPITCVGKIGKKEKDFLSKKGRNAYKHYRRLCDNFQFRVGRISYHDNIIFFPVKVHWRDDLSLENIEISMQILAETFEQKKVKTIYFPKIQPWEEVFSLIERYLGEKEMEIMFYE